MTIGHPVQGWVTVLATAEERLKWLTSAPMGTRLTWTHNSATWIKDVEGWRPEGMAWGDTAQRYPSEHVAQFAFAVDRGTTKNYAVYSVDEVERLSVNRDALQEMNDHLRAEVTRLTGANQTAVEEIDRLRAQVTPSKAVEDTYRFHAGDILKVVRNGVLWYGKARESRRLYADLADFSLQTSEGHIKHFNLNAMGTPGMGPKSSHYEVIYCEHGEYGRQPWQRGRSDL